jgi:hypothetical protein
MAANRSAAPIVAALLLLLPVLYIGSYLALVAPNKGGVLIMGGRKYVRYPYRYFKETSARVFYPLERIDRKLRPDTWNPSLDSPD